MASTGREVKRHTRRTAFQRKRANWLTYAHWKGQYIFWPLWAADPLILQGWHLFFTVSYVQKASDWVGMSIYSRPNFTLDLKKIKFRPKVQRLHLVLHCYNDIAFQLFQKLIFSQRYEINIREQRLSPKYWLESSLWLKLVCNSKKLLNV